MLGNISERKTRLGDWRTSVGARIAGAFVDVGLAMLSGVSWNAVASVAIDAVDTGGAVAARIAETLVDIVFAIASGSARLASALIAANQVFAMAAELARIRLAFVDLRLTE